MKEILAESISKPNVIQKNKYLKNFSINKYYYLMLLPGMLYLMIFKYIPMCGLVIAFKEYTFMDGIFGSKWSEPLFKWFYIAYISGDFVKVVLNTLIISLMKIVFNFPAPLILALLLNEVSNRYFKRTIQTIIYLPHFISWVVLSGVMFTLLSPSMGILSFLGIKTSPLLQPDNFRWLLVISANWKEAGWGTVVYLAAISGINSELYEAAIIDGANRLQQVLFITIPSIASTIAVLLILRTGQMLYAGFDQIFVLSSPLVYSVADIIDTYVYRVGLTTGRFSLASAVGLFQSVVGLILILLSNWTIRRMGEDGIF